VGFLAITDHDIYPGKNGLNEAAFDWISRYSSSYRSFWVEEHPNGE